MTTSPGPGSSESRSSSARRPGASTTSARLTPAPPATRAARETCAAWSRTLSPIWCRRQAGTSTFSPVTLIAPAQTPAVDDDRRADAAHALGILLVVEEVALGPDLGELDHQLLDVRDGVAGLLRHAGLLQVAARLGLGDRREHGLADRGAVHQLALEQVRREADGVAPGVDAADHDGIGRLEHRHARGQPRRRGEVAQHREARRRAGRSARRRDRRAARARGRGGSGATCPRPSRPRIRSRASVCRIANVLLLEAPSARLSSESVRPSGPASPSAPSTKTARSTLCTR